MFVNAGFGPGEAGQSVGIDTCENRVVNGRAYVGVHCSGGNLVTGFTPPFWATAGTGPKYPSVSIGTAPATSPFPAGFPFNEPTGTAVFPTASQPVQETTPNVSSGAPVAPVEGYRAVSGPSRTVTNTVVRNQDGVDQAVDAAGGDNALLQRNQNRIDRKNENKT